MKEFTIGKNDAGQRLDRWLSKAVPLLPAPLAHKYIRLKRVKLNGKGSTPNSFAASLIVYICCIIIFPFPFYL